MIPPHGGRLGVNAPDELPKISWKLLQRVLAYSLPYRGKIILMLGLILLDTGLKLLVPLIIRDLIDHTIPTANMQRLVMLALGLLMIPILSGALNIWRRRLNASIGEGVIYDLRLALYCRLQRMSLHFFTHTRVGELMSRLNNDVVGAQNAISSTIVDIITNSIQAIAVLGMMFALEWHLTLVSIIILPLFIVAARRLGKHLRDITRAQMSANAQMNAMMNETLNIGGALLVKLFGRQNEEVERFDERAQKVRDLGIHRAVMGVVFFAIVSLVGSIGTALVYGVGGYLVIQKAFTIGTIVAFGSYLANLYGSLVGLSSAPVELATSIVSFERVFEIIDLPIDIAEKDNALHLNTIRGMLEFENVSFHYEMRPNMLLQDVQRYGSMEAVNTVLSGEETKHSDAAEVSPESQAREIALENISFKAQPGQLIALVGPSGAGKTTLTYLIPRLYDPQSGRILLEGHDLRDISLDSLSAQIGMVTQETHLFHDTIRTNLLYARLDATQEQIEAAARTANIHNFIIGLPDAYQTVVGERGYRLSGGEKQRIALARVILKDPRILVLDEATSHLDSESETLIQDALRRVMAERTSIVIAHRLSTILAADLILVMDRGQIVEQGNHTELMHQNGFYAHLYHTQFKDRSLPFE